MQKTTIFAGGSLIGDAEGAASGFVGGISRGISDYRNGYDFWNGSRTDEFLSGTLITDNYDYAKVAESYNSSITAEFDTESLQERMYNIYGIKKGDMGINEFTTKGKYGLTTDGKYFNLSKKDFVGGYVIRNSGSPYTGVHISPYYVNENTALFKTVVGHELIHAYHYYSIPNFDIKNSERVAYKYIEDA